MKTREEALKIIMDFAELQQRIGMNCIKRGHTTKGDARTEQVLTRKLFEYLTGETMQDDEWKKYNIVVNNL